MTEVVRAVGNVGGVLVTAAQQTNDARTQKIDSLVADICEAFCKVSGTAAGIRAIAFALPMTPVLDEATTLCPELIFSALGEAVTDHANVGLDLVDQLQRALAGASK